MKENGAGRLLAPGWVLLRECASLSREEEMWSVRSERTGKTGI